MKWSKTHKYPTPVSGRDGFLLSLAFGLFVGLFLWFFEPFGLNMKPYSTVEISLFGVISFIVFFLAHTVLPLIQPKVYKENNWTIYSQIIFYLILSFVIATLNGIYINFINALSFSWSNYLMIIAQTFALAIIPITLYVLFSYYLKYKKIVEQSNLLDKQLNTLQAPQANQYTIQSHIKEESFTIDEDSFLYSKSNGNYIEVFIADQASKIYRMSLTDLEKQLASSDFMIRCHRSYFVNMRQIVKVTGNAQGLKLWMKEEQSPIPVSRKYLEEVKALFANR